MGYTNGILLTVAIKLTTDAKCIMDLTQCSPWDFIILFTCLLSVGDNRPAKLKVHKQFLVAILKHMLRRFSLNKYCLI